VPQNLDELPTPPEIAAEVQRYSRQRWLWGRRRREVEEGLKLQYYYGGQCVSYIRMNGSIVVMAAGRSGSPEYTEQLAAIPPEQRSNLILDIPCRWKDEVSEILTPEEL
jgi:hypothetical protein